VQRKLSTGTKETFYQHKRNFLLTQGKLSTGAKETFHLHKRNFLPAQKKLSTGARETFHWRKRNFLTAQKKLCTSILKCANTTKCVPTSASVLAFSQSFFFEGVKPLNFPRHSILTHMQS